MKAEEIASHYKAYHRYGFDVPVCLDALSRVVAWRDRQVTGWPKGVSIFKQVFAREPVWAELVPRLVAAELLTGDEETIKKILAQAPGS